MKKVIYMVIKHLKRCSASLVFRRQIKSPVSSHLTSQKGHLRESLEKANCAFIPLRGRPVLM